MIPNCAATRHAHFTLDGSGPSYLEKPNLNDWPKVEWKPSQEAIRVNLDTLTAEEVQSWKQGDRLLLNGKVLTGQAPRNSGTKDLWARGKGCRAVSGAGLTNYVARAIPE